MPFEFDDTGYRVFGYHQPIEFYDDSRALQATIYLQRDNTLNIGGETISRTGGESAVSVHALDSETHTGTLANWQGPQFLLTDGTRDLTGDLAIDDGDGDSPSLNFVGGTNDDMIKVLLSDDATAGNSDFVVRLCATDGDSQFVIQDSSPAAVAYIDADGNVSLNGDLAIAASGKGITHADGNTSGYVLLADGTRYVPADAAANLPVAPVAQGDILIADATPEWSVLTLGSQYTHLEAGAATVTWEANLTLVDDAWVGLGSGAGRLVFDSTPAPDQIEITTADLYFATTAHGIIHVDGNTSGWILMSDGTRYVPTDPGEDLPIPPVAQGDMLVADATPAWSILTLAAAAGYALVSTATTVAWDQTPAWSGLHTFGAGWALSGGTGDLNGVDLIIDTDGDSYLHASADDVVDLVLATASGEFAVNINSAEDFTFTANSFNVLAGSGVTMADETWIGFSAAGRLVFDSTPAPDQIEVTAADLYFATASHGIIHVDGNTSGYILQSDGTRYVPANPAGALPIPAVAQGDMLIANATPAWSILTIGATSTHLESGGMTATWVTSLTMADDTWIGLGAGAGRLVFDSTPAPDQVEVTTADLYIATTAHGIIHVDGVTAGQFLRANGTRYVPDTLDIGDLTDLAYATPNFTFSTSNAAGSADSVVRSDATIALFDATVPGTIECDDAATAGSAGVAARRDHQHAIICAAPGANLSVSTTNSEGSAASFARSDHSHAITSSSNPGAAASILATDASGYLQLLGLGIGAAAGADNRITMVNGGTIGQASGPLLTFDDTANELQISGCDVGIGDTSPDAKLDVVESDAVTAATTDVLILEHNTSGTAAANFGAGTLWKLEDAGGTVRDAMRQAVVWQSAASSEVAEFQLWLNNSGTLYDAGVIVGTTLVSATGNQRGVGAVDWQSYRTAITEVASGDYATLIGGGRCTASGDYSVAMGAAANATHTGEIAHGATTYAQRRMFILFDQILHDDNTWRSLYLDGAAEHIVMPSDSTWSFSVRLVGMMSGAAHNASYHIVGIAENDGGTSALLDSEMGYFHETDATWNARVIVTDATNTLKIQVQDTDGASQTVRWVGVMDVTYVQYGA